MRARTTARQDAPSAAGDEMRQVVLWVLRMVRGRRARDHKHLNGAS
jgi:hypothetical protein